MIKIVTTLEKYILKIQKEKEQRNALDLILLVLILISLPFIYNYTRGGYRNLLFVSAGLFLAWIISIRILSNIRLLFPISMIVVFFLNNFLIWNSRIYKGVENRWDYMDFLKFVKTGYGPLYGTSYPPMAIYIYRVFQKLVTVENDDKYVLNYAVFLIIFSSLILLLICSHIYMQKNSSLKEKEISLVSLSMLFTSQYLFSVQRLNIIIYAEILIMIFLLLYDSNDKYKKCFALISLAFAANIKIYPAVFGVLLLKKKMYKEAIISFVFGIIMLFLPLSTICGMENRVRAIKDMIEGIFGYANSWAGSGISLSAKFIQINERFNFLGQENAGIVGSVITICFFVLSLICAFVCNKEHVQLAMCGFMCIFVPSISFWYSVLFLIPAILSLISKSQEYDLFDMIELCCLIVISMYGYCDTALFHMSSIWHLLLLWIVCILDTIRESVAKRDCA